MLLLKSLLLKNKITNGYDLLVESRIGDMYVRSPWSLNKDTTNSKYTHRLPVIDFINNFFKLLSPNNLNGIINDAKVLYKDSDIRDYVDGRRLIQDEIDRKKLPINVRLYYLWCQFSNQSINEYYLEIKNDYSFERIVQNKVAFANGVNYF